MATRWSSTSATCGRCRLPWLALWHWSALSLTSGYRHCHTHCILFLSSRKKCTPSECGWGVWSRIWFKCSTWCWDSSYILSGIRQYIVYEGWFAMLAFCFAWNLYSLVSTSSFSLFHDSLCLTLISSSLSLFSFRPAGGRSTWTATACDLISYYLSGASAVMTIKVFLSFPLLMPAFLSPLSCAEDCNSSSPYLHTVLDTCISGFFKSMAPVKLYHFLKLLLVTSLILLFAVHCLPLFVVAVMT